jgi:hypothetical protein
MPVQVYNTVDSIQARLRDLETELDTIRTIAAEGRGHSGMGRRIEMIVEEQRKLQHNLARLHRESQPIADPEAARLKVLQEVARIRAEKAQPVVVRRATPVPRALNLFFTCLVLIPILIIALFVILR